MTRSSRTYILVIFFGIFAGVLVSMYISAKNNPAIYQVTLTQQEDPTPTPADYCVNAHILTYHHIQPFEDAEPKNQLPQTVSPYNFDWHMRTLVERGYTFISTDTLIDAIEQRKPLPNKAIVVTLDDSYRDHYTYAFQTAKKYNIILNIGVITGLTGNPEHLTVWQMQQMHDSGLINFINHSWSHRNLKSDEPEMIRRQITNAEESLEEWLGVSKKTVIYPYGVYNDLTLQVMQEENFKAGFILGFDEGTQHCQSNLLALPRYRVGNAGPGVYDL